MNWYMMVLKNYVTFNGRARRKEYWMFFLINMIISAVLMRVDQAIMNQSNQIIQPLYALAVLLPSIAVGVRRMHDVGKSGWFLLIPIYNLILAVTDGDKGDNEYGQDPKGEQSPSNGTLDDHMIK